MSRLMSFALTEASFLDGTKTMTRRLGWWTDKNGRRLLLPGDRITGCRKVMGRKKGDPLVRLGEAHVTAVYRQRLIDMPDGDVQHLLIAARDDLAAKRQEILPAVGADEIFMQDIGAGRVAVIQRRHRLVHQRIAGRAAAKTRIQPGLKPPSRVLYRLAVKLAAIDSKMASVVGG